MEYVVQKGDTLWDIAARLLGSGSRWRELGYSGNPNTMPIGTVLSVPEGGEQAPVAADPISAGDQMVDDSLKVWEDLLPSTPDPIEPFEFDKELARQAVTAETSPYYNELRQDYLSRSETEATRIVEDRDASLGLLGERREDYMQDTERSFSDALEKSREGFAGKNMFFSGDREEAGRKLGEQKEEGISDYEREYGFETGQRKQTATRGLADIGTQKETFQRDVGRDEQYEIERGVAGRRGEALDQYISGAIATYYGQSGFGSWNDYVK